ncbi:MAG: family 20 glycosylhydrolase [Chitinophagaceae bacterium]|nr:family 20 glycosylhydrolase [Chitinophagaceae bacterium]
MRKLVCAICILVRCFNLNAQDSSAMDFPVKGFAIAAPTPLNLDSFIVFINNELAPRGINTLVLRVDYNYQYKSHPELAIPNALSAQDVQKLVIACSVKSINIIPQINLLGHQSWAGKLSKLLEVYPQFDETPWVKMPAQYTWPNSDSLYCKSYCPLHPGVHKIVFDLVDEICDAFRAKAFHAGMDEVFYLGMDKCPRCGGKNKAGLFAGEVNGIRDHLAKSGRQLWIWGDRLLDGYTTGIGEWEASFNGTSPAIDMVPKDIIVCDWHYERADKTPVIFAAKGLRVITCAWNRPETGAQQVRDMIAYRKESTSAMSSRFYGMMETIWSDVSSFFKNYYGPAINDGNEASGQANTFRTIFPLKNLPANSE